ncbi:MAG: branched-chain amino acid ABC transporter substrate-binding protein [Syntrophobacteria bacterium]
MRRRFYETLRFRCTLPRARFSGSVRLLLVLAMAAFCGGCGEQKPEACCNGRARIAVVAPLSGSLQEEGQMLRLGALTAVREAQGRAAELRVEMVVHESPCNADKAARVARRVAEDTSVSLVVGYLCAEAVCSVLPIYSEADLALISPTVSAEYVHKEESRHLFPLLYGDSEQAAFLAAYIKKALALTRVAVLSDESAYGRMLMSSFMAEAKRQKLKVVGYASSSPEPVEVARVVDLFKGADPEAIFLAAYPETARLFLLERHRQNLGGKVLSPDPLADRDLYEVTGQAVEGLLVCQPLLLDTGNPTVAGFVRRFEQFHKRQPDWIAAGAYDAMRLALEVLDRSGPRRVAVLRGLRAIAGPDTAFRCLSGPLFFRKEGGNRRRFFVGTFHQGFFQPADPPSVQFHGSI